MPYLSGLTTIANFKQFWPQVFDEVQFQGMSPAALDAQLTFYATRADLLINRLGQLDNSVEENVLALQMGANLLMWRLIVGDAHPAAITDAAGMLSETAHGLSWSAGRVKVPKTIRDVVGEEVATIVANCIKAGSVIGKQDQQVFDSHPFMGTTDDQGNHVDLFDTRLDDPLGEPLSEQLGLAKTRSRYPTLGTPNNNT